MHVCHIPAHTGLLADADTDYYVAPSPDHRPVGYQSSETYNQSSLTLEDELDNRFGDSTLPSIRGDFDRRDKMSMPPRGLFDDV